MRPPSVGRITLIRKGGAIAIDTLRNRFLTGNLLLLAGFYGSAIPTPSSMARVRFHVPRTRRQPFAPGEIQHRTASRSCPYAPLSVT